MMRTKTLKSRIKLTEAALVKLKERYERKSRELLAMKKELQTAQAAEILSALRKSGRSYEELMTFLVYANQIARILKTNAKEAELEDEDYEDGEICDDAY